MIGKKGITGLLAALTILVPVVTLAQTRVTELVSEQFTAENWVKNTAYSTVGVRVVNASNVYQVITAGTSENTDNAGPKTTSTGYPSDITDGTVHWKWIGTTATFGIDNSSTAGEVALSKVINAQRYDAVVITARATGTSSDRVLTVSCMAKDGTTVLFSFPTVAVAANSSAKVEIRPDARQDPTYTIAWQASTAYRVGERATNDTGKMYEVITAGTSAASGGPTGVTADITDNTAHWKYVGMAGAAPTGVTYINTTPCPKMKASIAAISAGSGITADLAIYGRRPTSGATINTKGPYYESGSVASGAALATTIDTSALSSVQVITEAVTTGRTLVVTCLDKYERTTFTYPSFTITAANKYLLTYRFDAVIPSVEATNVKHVPAELCPAKMKFSIAAAGGASAKLAVYGR